MDMPERRQLKRLKVSIPCTVKWGKRALKGQITNLSMSGASITPLNSLPPPEDASVTVKFQVKKDEVTLVSSVSSRVVHTLFEVVEGKAIGSFGVQFEDQSEEVQSQLEAVVSALAPE